MLITSVTGDGYIRYLYSCSMEGILHRLDPLATIWSCWTRSSTGRNSDPPHREGILRRGERKESCPKTDQRKMKARRACHGSYLYDYYIQVHHDGQK